MNESGLKREISISELSKSFQDAVKVVRGIGIQYLWIDTLYIVQDDQEDWQQESKNMADIYSGSYLTIGATRASNCETGFLQPREQAVNVGSYSIGNMGFDVLARRGGNYIGFLGSVEAEFVECLLFRQGWCFQERILAPRMLHFANRELIYHCREGKECECGRSKIDIRGGQDSCYESI
jgi:hypothetical protein